MPASSGCSAAFSQRRCCGRGRWALTFPARPQDPAIPSSTLDSSGGIPRRSLHRRVVEPAVFYPMAGSLALSASARRRRLTRRCSSWARARWPPTRLSSCRSRSRLLHLPAGSLPARPRHGGIVCIRSHRRSRVAARLTLRPYRAGQLAHFQVLHSQWMPLALLAMHGYLDADAASGWFCSPPVASPSWSNGYYLLFFPVLIGLWLRTSWIGGGRRGRGVHLAAAWGGRRSCWCRDCSSTATCNRRSDWPGRWARC